jgi:uncharacterized protein DUF3761
MARRGRPADQGNDRPQQLVPLIGAGRRGRWARAGAGVAGLALLVGLGACSPATTPTSTSYGSSTYGSSTADSSTNGSSTYGSSTYGAPAYGASGSSSSGSSSSGSSSGSGSYGGSYTNSDGQQVERPDGDSSGATAVCKDGTDSHSKHRSGTCSGHGGVREWL